jgi:hypothetical protein
VLHGTRWREKFARGFAINYARHPHYADAEEIIQALLACTAVNLADLNEFMIRFMAARLGLSPALHRASSIRAEGTRSARLAALCLHFQANEYISPVGSAEYLAADGFAERSTVRLRFQSYSPCAYPQRGCATFQSHLSVVDVVANLGWDQARSYVSAGCV